MSSRYSLYSNSFFLILNTFAGSLLGFLFWVIAARNFSPAIIGVGAAYITTITLLSSFGDMGLSITLVRFLPLMEGQEAKFVNTAAIAGVLSTLIITSVFIAGVPFWAPDLFESLTSAPHVVLFVLITLVFNLTQLLDKLYIAKRVTQFLFMRTLIANILKIAFMITVSLTLGAFGLAVAVGVGTLISLGAAVLFFWPRIFPEYDLRDGFAWPILWQRAYYSLANHFSQLLWNSPPLVYPLIIVGLLGAKSNAYFYTCWMLANVLFILPTAASTSAFAHAANDDGKAKLWKVMYLTLLLLIPLAGIFIVFSRLALGMFGSEYVMSGRELLILLAISALPYTLNTFLITSYRIAGDNKGLIVISSLISGLSLLFVVWFGTLWQLSGVGIGWLVGQSLGALLALLFHGLRRTVLRPKRLFVE